MKVSFRQGLISYQQNGAGEPRYLLPNGNTVELNISPVPLVATFAHGTADYLQVFRTDKEVVWGPLTPDVHNYLYWDIDLLTGSVSGGITLLPLITSADAPPSPIDDQHWFDTTSTQMKVWDQAVGVWRNKVRLFAGRARLGVASNLDQYGSGSQVGLDVPANAGYIVLDENLRALRNSNGTMLTTDTPVRIKSTTGTSGVLAQPVSYFVPARAAENLPQMSVVKIVGEDTIGLATPYDLPVGLVLADVLAGDVATVATIGEISYDQWDWSASIGKMLFIGATGEIVDTKPNGNVFKVGVAKSKTTIILGIDGVQAASDEMGAPFTEITASAPLIAVRDESSIALSIPPATTVSNGYMSHDTFNDIEALKEFHTLATGPQHLASEYKIDRMANVDIDGTQPDGSVLSFDLASGTWKPLDIFNGGSGGGGGNPGEGVQIVNSVNTLTGNVVLTTDQVPEGSLNLYYSQERFDNAFEVKKLDDLADVDVTLAELGQVLTWDGMNWIPTNVPGAGGQIVTSVAGRTGAVILSTTDVAEGANLYYTLDRFTNDFEATIEVTSIKALADVNDDMLPVLGDVLTWNGEEWASNPPALAPVLSVNTQIGNVTLTTTDIPEGSNAYYTLDRFLVDFQDAFSEKNLNDLADVDGLAETDMVLTWTGSMWTPKALGETAGPIIDDKVDEAIAEIKLNDLVDVDTAGALEGFTIVFDAAQQMWKADVPPSAPVTSVNGLDGEVVLTTSNIEEGSNRYFTDGYFMEAFNEAIIEVPITKLLDVDPGMIPEDGEVLQWDANLGKWTSDVPPSAPVYSVNSYTGTVVLNTDDIDEPAQGSSDTHRWFTTERVQTVISSSSIDDLSDVTLTNPANGEYLVYSGGGWINSNITQGAAGDNMQIQVNESGIFTGYADFKWDEENKVFNAGGFELMTGGDNNVGGTFAVIGVASHDFGVLVGGERGLKIKGTQDLFSLEMPPIEGGDGGSISFVARNGVAQGPGSADGGGIELTIGRASGGGEPGAFVVKTTTAEHLRIPANTGAFLINQQSGTNGQVLMSTGPNTPPTWSNPAPMAAGTDKQVQYNNNGATAGSSKFTWDNVNGILQLSNAGPAKITNADGGATDNSIIVQGGAGGIYEGGTVTVKGGANGTSTEAGKVIIQGGSSSVAAASGKVIIQGGITETGVGPAGDVDINGGTSQSSGGNVNITSGKGNSISGSIINKTYNFIQFSTNIEDELFASRFVINSNGSWSLGAPGTNRGTVGQILTSTGPDSAPQWMNPGATLAAGSNTHVQYNNNGSLGGTGAFAFDNTTNTINVGTNPLPGTIAGSDAVGAVSSLTVRGGNGTNGSAAGSLNLIGGTASGTSPGGAVVIRGGSGAGSGAPGNVTIAGADFPVGGSDAAGGSVTILGGKSSGTGTSGSILLQTTRSGSAGGAIVFSTSITSTTVERMRITATGAFSFGSTGTATGTAGQVLVTNGAAATPTWQDYNPYTFVAMALSDETTALTTGVSKITFRAPFAMTLTQIPRASLKTASSSGAVVTDIKVNGTSILGATKLTIDQGLKTSVGSTATTLATTAILDDAEITMDITSAGTNAVGLKVVLYYRKT